MRRGQAPRMAPVTSTSSAAAERPLPSSPEMTKNAPRPWVIRASTAESRRGRHGGDTAGWGVEASSPWPSAWSSWSALRPMASASETSTCSALAGRPSGSLASSEVRMLPSAGWAVGGVGSACRCRWVTGSTSARNGGSPSIIS